MMERPVVILALLVAFLLLLAPLPSHGQGDNLPSNHQAHAISGDDRVVYDLDDDGKQSVQLDGSKSHSHYFSPGPPPVNGFIANYTWEDTSGKLLCKTEKCSVSLAVGITTVNLTVIDNTGDVAWDTTTITVKPASAVTGKPSISTLEPSSGAAVGGQAVTIKGQNFYDDATVQFGDKAATDVVWVDVNTITVKTPALPAGTVNVTVTTGQGVSDGKEYTYASGSGGAVQFEAKSWMNKDGSEYVDAAQITSIVIGPDGRYYLASLTGIVYAVRVGKDLKVQSSCSGAQLPADRSIYGIAWNPTDKQNRVVITTNTQYWKSKPGGTWYNGKVESVLIEKEGSANCLTLGETIISGLPVSNYDHAVSTIRFTNGGQDMLVTVAGTSNAGYTDPAGDKLGGIPESPLSGAILVAPGYLKAGFDGSVKYNQLKDPATAKVVGGDVSVYAPGFRNSFGLLVDPLSGLIFATDNGANSGFGKASTSCTTEGDDPQTGDWLYQINQGNYYGHPNRNRGKTDSRQCTYRGKGSTPEIAKLTSSTNGIISYTANTFGGSLKGSLILTRFAFANPGETYRIELDGNGKITAGPYVIFQDSGLSIVQGEFGQLVMPRLQNQNVLVLVPVTDGNGTSTNTSVRAAGRSGHGVISVYPSTGPAVGGTDLLVSGQGFSDDATVRVGGRPCERVRHVSRDALWCTTPPGIAGERHAVTVTQGGLTSPVYGADFSYGL
jgi:glucose/arabinose dehydrogenase